MVEFLKDIDVVFSEFFKKFRELKKRYLIYFALLVLFVLIFGIIVKIFYLWLGFYIIDLIILILGSFIITYKFKIELKDNLFYNFQIKNFKISSSKELFPFNGQNILVDSGFGDYLSFVDEEGDSFEYKTDSKIFRGEQIFGRNTIYGDKSIIWVLYRYFIIIGRKLDGNWNIQGKFFIPKRGFSWYLLNFLTYSIFGFIISVFLLSIIGSITGLIDIDMILIISIGVGIVFGLYFLMSRRKKVAAENVPKNIKNLIEKGWMLNFKGDTVYLVKNLWCPYLDFTMFNTRTSVISKIKRYLEEIDFVVNNLKNL